MTKPAILKLYFIAAFIEGVITFLALATLHSDSKNAIFAGYSLSRLALLSGTGGISLGALFFTIRAFSKSEAVTSNVEKLSSLYFIFLPSAFSTSALFVLLAPLEVAVKYAAILERISPFVYLLGIIGLQTLIARFLWLKHTLHFENLLQWKPAFKPAGFFIAVAFVIYIGLLISGLGLQPKITSQHYYPGTPLVFYQIIFALIIGIILWRFEGKIIGLYGKLRGRYPAIPKLDAILFILIWVMAFFIWNNEPMQSRSYFTPKPTPPNFENYPYSDAAFYDETANRILIGESENQTSILRPLYVFTIALFHFISGRDYDTTIALQTFMLAIIPAFAYMLASKLGNRGAGIVSAALIILREKNSIALTNVIEVSNSKLILSDMLTFAAMTAFVTLFVHWLTRRNENAAAGIVAGFAFGLTVLIRSQTQLLLPIILFGIFFADKFNIKRIARQSLLFIAGFLIVSAPWLYRNHQIYGRAFFENADYYLRIHLIGTYTEPSDITEQLSNESEEEYSARVKGLAVKYVLNHPAEITYGFAAHYVHNEVGSLAYLPVSLKLDAPKTYIKQIGFWDEPFIDLSGSRGVLFAFNICIICLGLGTAYTRLNITGIIPLVIHLAYNFSNVPSHLYGWRFNLPVDWILQLYFSIGLIQIVAIIYSIFWNRFSITQNEVEPPASTLRWKLIALMGIFFAVGSSLPLSEKILPARYDAQEPIIESIKLDNGISISSDELAVFQEANPNAVIAQGLALYPSFYTIGNYWGDDNAILLAASHFDRLQFKLIGPYESFVFIPAQTPPEYFPNASDVLVIGCVYDGYLQALAVNVNQAETYLSAQPWDGLKCK